MKLRVRDLDFYYGKFHALKGINLDVPEFADGKLMPTGEELARPLKIDLSLVQITQHFIGISDVRQYGAQMHQSVLAQQFGKRYTRQQQLERALLLANRVVHIRLLAEQAHEHFGVAVPNFDGNAQALTPKRKAL